MKQLPKVSIIIPSFNRRKLIEETVQSVIAQSYKHWELLIVDDGSTDDSFAYLQYQASINPRIKVWQRERLPKGASTCRNIALENATGTYILFLDSDDLLAPHCLEQRTKIFEQNSHYDFLVFPIQYFENKIGDRQDIFFRRFHEDYLTSFLLKSYWITMSPIWKKEAVLKIGGFDEELACMQDRDLHIRAIIKGEKFKIFYDKSLVDGYLRVSNSHERISNNISSVKLDSKVLANQKLYKLLQKKQMLSPLRQRMVAAHYLNISWNYHSIGCIEKANDLWKEALQKGMISQSSYLIGKSFIWLRNMPLIRHSRIVAGIIKKIHQLLLPKFLLRL
ncbi:glycosyltransferase involved in cell wall biosynthesis [Catalinimonas alkaloidigena]|uniref:glycosyltransferase family 2 protein n=1 Tax=Catalinimonas alkaloidigena TaxID=1075417 RepID=UPI0024057317|nr:glycosyltransferase [Catalinimonas alkaloidigena]MDF9801091.1 glycosyltransferase involved in cell wall biosynthesis [Catalinimonas alkaloidigena]